MHVLFLALLGLFETAAGALVAVFLNADLSAFGRGALTPIMAAWIVIIDPLQALFVLSLVISFFISVFIVRKEN